MRVSFEGECAPVKPKFIGRRVFNNVDLATIAQYIDWGPFFQTWDLAGPFPAILQDAVVGETATKVFAEGQALLKKVIEGRWLTANGVIALLPANSVNDDDIEIYTDDSRSEVAFTYYGVRQQTEKPVIDGVARPNQCLADFIAPKSSGINDYIGMFAVTAGLGIEKYEKRFEDALDDYSSIMLKSLADRLAEAFAEHLHERVRTDLWGYAARGTAGQGRADQGKLQGHPPGARLSGLPRAYGQGRHVQAAAMRRDRHAADRIVRDVSGRGGIRLLLRAPAVEVFQRRQDRQRPARRHGGAARCQQGRRRALAIAEPVISAMQACRLALL